MNCFSNFLKMGLLAIFLSASTMANIVYEKDENGPYFVVQKLDDQLATKWHNYSRAAEDFIREQIRGPLSFVAHGWKDFKAIDETSILDKLLKKYNPNYASLDNTSVGEIEKNAPGLLNRNFTMGLCDGLSNFGRAVAHSKTKADVHVVFASTTDPREFDFNDSKDFNRFFREGHLQMAMAVLTQNGGGFIVVHMGIARNPYNFLNGTQHPRISTKLHGFAADKMQAFYPNQVHTMITTPLESMTNILMQAGLNADEISVGKPEEGLRTGPRLVLTELFPYMKNGQAAKLTLKDNAGQIIYEAEGAGLPSFTNLIHCSHPFVVVDLSSLAKLWPRKIDG
jgi:hypothetical protein